jgi:XRE family aerobic/anaerobic benzoate catabolism transcriptional regulator
VSREPLYARASTIVDTGGLSKEKAAAQLISTVSHILDSNAETFGLRSAAS